MPTRIKQSAMNSKLLFGGLHCLEIHSFTRGIMLTELRGWPVTCVHARKCQCN